MNRRTLAMGSLIGIILSNSVIAPNLTGFLIAQAAFFIVMAMPDTLASAPKASDGEG